MSGNQVLGFLIALTFQKTNPYQFFDCGSTGSWCPQPFTLCIFRHFLRTGGFHTLKKRIFRKMFGRRGFSFPDFCGMNAQSLANRKGWELLSILLFLITAFSRELFPPFLHDGFALCRKDIISIGKLDHAFVVPERFTDRTKQAGGNQSKNSLFAFRKFLQTVFQGFFGGDNCVVVRNFLIVDHLRCMNPNVFHILHWENVEKRLYQFRKHIFHIACQIPAVSTRISDQFFLVQPLGIVQRLLCCESQNTVCISLQRSQIIQSRRFF